jgi:hypothetical protein
VKGLEDSFIPLRPSRQLGFFVAMSKIYMYTLLFVYISMFLICLAAEKTLENGRRLML